MKILTISSFVLLYFNCCLTLPLPTEHVHTFNPHKKHDRKGEHVSTIHGRRLPVALASLSQHGPSDQAVLHGDSQGWKEGRRGKRSNEHEYEYVYEGEGDLLDQEIRIHKSDPTTLQRWSASTRAFFERIQREWLTIPMAFAMAFALLGLCLCRCFCKECWDLLHYYWDTMCGRCRGEEDGYADAKRIARRLSIDMLTEEKFKEMKGVYGAPTNEQRKNSWTFCPICCCY